MIEWVPMFCSFGLIFHFPLIWHPIFIFNDQFLIFCACSSFFNFLIFNQLYWSFHMKLNFFNFLILDFQWTLHMKLNNSLCLCLLSGFSLFVTFISLSFLLLKFLSPAILTRRWMMTMIIMTIFFNQRSIWRFNQVGL